MKVPYLARNENVETVSLRRMEGYDNKRCSVSHDQAGSIMHDYYFAKKEKMK